MLHRGPHTPIFDPAKRRGQTLPGAVAGTRPVVSFHDRVFNITTPIRYWACNDASSPLVDEVAAFNLTVTGSPTYQAAPISTIPHVPTSQSINLTGTSWAEGTTGAVGGALSFTVFGWVKFTTSSAVVLIQQRDAAAFLGEWMMGTISFGGTSDSKLRAWGFGTDGAMEFDLASPVTINDGLPHLVGFSVDQSDTTARLWLDGVLVATDATPNGSLFDSTLNIALGRDVRDNNKTFTGKMSDFGIDLGAWTAAEWAYVYGL